MLRNVLTLTNAAYKRERALYSEREIHVLNTHIAVRIHLTKMRDTHTYTCSETIAPGY